MAGLNPKTKPTGGSFVEARIVPRADTSSSCGRTTRTRTSADARIDAFGASCSPASKRTDVPSASARILPATTASPFDTAAAVEALRRVQQAILALDLDHRAVFILYELEGDSCDAIAAAMEIPVGTVHSRLHAARKGFRIAYDGLDPPQKSAMKSDPSRLREDPSVRRDQRRHLALSAITDYPKFDVPHGLAHFHASVTADAHRPETPATSPGAPPTSVAISVKLVAGVVAVTLLGARAAAWIAAR